MHRFNNIPETNPRKKTRSLLLPKFSRKGNTSLYLYPPTSQNIFQIPIIPSKGNKAEDTGNCAQVDEIHSGYRTDLTPSPSLPLSFPPPAPSAQVLLARNAWSFCRAAQSKAAPVECYNFALPLSSPPPSPPHPIPLLSKSLYLSRYFPNSDVPSGPFSSAFAVTTTTPLPPS